MRDLTAYITMRLGCTHPYRVSRILVLLNWLGEDRLGKGLVPLHIKGFEAAFYVEGLKEVFEGECFRKNEARKCFTYECSNPGIPKEVAELIDELIRDVRELNDIDLNRLVIKNPKYKELIKG